MLLTKTVGWAKRMWSVRVPTAVLGMGGNGGHGAARLLPTLRCMAEQTLDLRGLRCPLPALKARKVLSRLTPGDALVLECTDPLTAIDIPNLVRETGDVLEANSEHAGLLVFRIRKAGAHTVS
jgi:tRNA 2-thiouridine synthesizing protein A